MNIAQTEENITMASTQFKNWVCDNISDPTVMTMITSNPARLNILRLIHIFHEITYMDILICVTDLIEAGVITYQNTSEAFEYLVSIGMHPGHAKFMREDDGKLNFGFTRGGVDFLISKIPQFKDLVKMYKSIRNK